MEEKLLWRAHRKSPTLFRAVPRGTLPGVPAVLPPESQAFLQKIRNTNTVSFVKGRVTESWRKNSDMLSSVINRFKKSALEFAGNK